MEQDIIVVIYSLMLKQGLSAVDIYDMSINERTRLEVLIISCACSSGLGLKLMDYVSLMPRITMFLTKYCGALNV
jgi:hypothetical protein